MKNRKELHFSGVYKDAFEGYVKYKTALGFNVEYRETLALVTLNEFLNRYDPPAAIITERMAVDYVHRNPLLSSTTVHVLEEYFVKYLSVERGCSINTRKNYRDTFVELFGFLNETMATPSNKICMETFSFDTINSFLDWLEKTKDVSVATRNNRLAGIKSFFKYVSYKELCYLNLCNSILDIKTKKNISAPMNYLTIAAVEQLFASFDLNDPGELRDFCIIALLYESCARVSELIFIKLCEIRLDMPSTVVLHGKGGKSRIVPIDRALAICIPVQKRTR